MIEEDVEDNMKNFVDTNTNAFRDEVLTLKKSKHKSQMGMEADTKKDKGDLWTMSFDRVCCKDAPGVGIFSNISSRGNIQILFYFKFPLY